jgi:hypothetical protein
MTAKAKELNDACRKVVAEFGGIEINDLFKPMDALNRDIHWSDTFHFRKTAKDMQAAQVSEACLSAIKK